MHPVAGPFTAGVYRCLALKCNKRVTEDGRVRRSGYYSEAAWQSASFVSARAADGRNGEERETNVKSQESGW